jgi:hypothetical protein
MYRSLDENLKWISCFRDKCLDGRMAQLILEEVRDSLQSGLIYSWISSIVLCYECGNEFSGSVESDGSQILCNAANISSYWCQCVSASAISKLIEDSDIPDNNCRVAIVGHSFSFCDAGSVLGDALVRMSRDQRDVSFLQSEKQIISQNFSILVFKYSPRALTYHNIYHYCTGLKVYRVKILPS